MPERVKLAPEQWRRIGEEVSDKLDYEPGRFLCRRTVRPKPGPRRGSTPTDAPRHKRRIPPGYEVYDSPDQSQYQGVSRGAQADAYRASLGGGENNSEPQRGSIRQASKGSSQRQTLDFRDHIVIDLIGAFGGMRQLRGPDLGERGSVFRKS